MSPLEQLQAWADRRTGRSRPAAQLTIRTLRDSIDDRVPGLAAEVAFYLILSLPPLLVTVLAAVGLIGDAVVADFESQTVARVQEIGGNFLTPGATDSIADLVRQVMVGAQASLLSIGFLVTVFTASRAFRVLTIAITIAYDLEDERPTWKQFVYGLLLTVAAIAVGIVVVPLFVAGPGFGAVIGDALGLQDLFGRVWSIAYWPSAAVVATLLLGVLYHVAAPWRTPWRRDLPGAVLAAVLGLVGSFGLRLYAATAIAGDRVFRPLAAPLVILLWLYVMAFAVLLGAELNAEIERLWPTETTLGQRRTAPTTDADPTPA